ncbi:hypothetical protein RHGRI_019286 [Rhododendron griersonianum]|uniref:MAGE domain-containing protein n=1 Tax=Rhododendron griersonianum TaxID=479676 RepID=A0AAV6JEM2_9ERIC|nr:hypothetical protein RHGRI_019286 [Rhododendron griersonianum]
MPKFGGVKAEAASKWFKSRLLDPGGTSSMKSYRMATAEDDFSQFDISTEEKDRLVAEVIRYVLFKTQQNSGCPIKRDELTQLVTKNHRQRALPGYVINVAKEKLLNTFGYEMRELQRSRSSTNQGRASQQTGNDKEAKEGPLKSSEKLTLAKVLLDLWFWWLVELSSAPDSKSYVIISHLPADVYKKYIEDANSSHLTGFTFVVISVVYLAGGKITEENLWHHLRRLGLSENDEGHPTLGNIKQALEGLVQQRYLQKEKSNGPEGNTLVYELAERALDGPISERIKEYISQFVQKDAAPADAD